MAFAYFDRVKESSTTAGLGVFTLAGAIAGFQAFSARYANGDTLHYTIFQASTGAWEVGLGTWLTGNQLQRTTVLASSNANALVNFAAGSKEVFVTNPAVVDSLCGARMFVVADVTARDAIPAAALRTNMLVLTLATNAFYRWTGSAWVSFGGFAPTGSAVGQTQIWNGTGWAAGALDLADPDAVGSSILGPNNGGTGIAGAGGTPNRVLLTTNGTSWAAGLVNLASMVTGTLAVTGLAAAVGFSVLGRAATGSGDRADIAASQVGQVLRRDGSGLSFGALDLADSDAVNGLLPGTNVDPAFGTRNISTTGTLSAGKTALTPLVETSGSPFALRVTGAAHTTLAASGEVVDLDFALGRTVQLATGAVSQQRAARFAAPTYSFVGASVISDAATIAITGAPAAGTNATITRSYSLWAQAGLGRFDAGIAFGATVGSTGELRGGTSFSLVGKRTGGVTDQTYFSYDAATSTFLDHPSTITARILGTTTHVLGSAALTSHVRDYLWNDAVATPRLMQQATAGLTGALLSIIAQESTAIGGTGGALNVQAGDATGPSGTRTGGAATFRSGTGTSAHGVLTLGRGSVSVLVANATSTTVGESTLSDLVLGSTASLRLNGTAAMTWGSTIQIVQAAGILEYASAILTPTIRQLASSAASATGGAFLINAQDVSGTGASGGSLTIRGGDSSGASGTRNGGNVVMRVGTGITAPGQLTVYAGNGAGGYALFGRNNANNADILLTYWDAPNQRLILGDSSTLATGYIYLQSNLIQMRVGTNSAMDFTTSLIRPMINSMSWDAGATAPTITQVTATGAVATGAPFTLASQDCSGTTTTVGGSMLIRAGDATGGAGTRTGGALTLRSGTGATAYGQLLIQGGSGLYGLRLTGRNAANTDNIDVIYWDSTTSGNGPTIVIGSTGVGEVVAKSRSTTGAFSVSIGSGTVMRVGPTQTDLSTPLLQFSSAVSAPSIGQQVVSTASITATSFTLFAQDASGTTNVTAGAMLIRAGDATGASGIRNGGALTVRSGTGASSNGDLTLQRGTVDVLKATATAGMTITIGSGVGPIVMSCGGAIDYSVYMIPGGVARNEFASTFIDFDDQTALGTSPTWSIKGQGTDFFQFGKTAGVPGIRFFPGGSLASQAADPGALTAASGTASGTITSVGGAFNTTTLDNNFKSLAEKYNTLRNLVRAVGLAA